MPSSRRPRRVLFIQATEPGGYPPLINASALMADAGWDVTFLSAPVGDSSLPVPPYPRIAIRKIHPRPSHVMRKSDYLIYCAKAAYLALLLRPDVVYASDPLGAGPGRLAATLARATLVYHEHDSPTLSTLNPRVARQRLMAARSARLVIVPNEARAEIVQAELGFDPDRLRIVWNVPRRSELPALPSVPLKPLIVYYHGTISPERVPPSVVDAIKGIAGRVRLRVAGYDAPGSPGYAKQLVDSGRLPDGTELVEYVGLLPRSKLLKEAARAHIGIAFMPKTSRDINMIHMTGASNKAFDYMAAGLALLVNDQADWRRIFVEPGYGRCCDPDAASDVAACLEWFLENTHDLQAISSRNRRKIEADWNYDTQFSPIMKVLENA